MSLQRVQYREGQVLTAQDLMDEQHYREALRRRHNTVLHGWGILSGLELRHELGRLVLEPGLAVDALGRELVVMEQQILPGQVTAAIDEQGLLLWLRYAVVPVASSRGHTEQPARLREEARLCIRRATSTPGDATLSSPAVRAPACRPRRRATPPATTDSNLLKFADEPTGGIETDWPVFLGRVYRESGEIRISTANRPYAILVGGTVRSASTMPVPENPQAPSPTPLPPVPRATIALGETATGRSHFAVALPDAQGRLTERLVIEAEAETRIYGPMSLAGCQTTATDSDAPANLSFARQSERIEAWQISDPEALAGKLDRLFAEQTGYRSVAYLQTERPPMEKPPPSLLREELTQRLNALLNEAPAGDKQATDSERDPYSLTRTRPASSTLEALLLGAQQAKQLRLRPQTTRLLRRRLRGRVSRAANRYALEDLFPCEIEPGPMDTGAYRLMLRPPAQAPVDALPWRIYRVDIEREGKRIRQLRIELPAPDDESDPTATQLTIGHFMNDDFQPCLTVDAGCTVTVADMRVLGRIIQGPVRADPEDPRLLEALAQAWLKGNSLGGDLELLLLNFQPNQSGATLVVRVRNGGRTDIHEIRLHETHSLNNGTVQSMSLPGISILRPGEVIDRQVSYDIQPGTLYVAVQAAGSSQHDLSVPVYGQARGQFIVPPQPDPIG